MGSHYQKNIIFLWMALLVTNLDLGRQKFIEGLQTIDKNNFPPKPEGTIKTIEVHEDGELIDCVDINKQPTLRNPLIKDKTVQMKPSSSLIHAFNKTNYPPLDMIQNWHKYGECPKETVPITRTWNYNETIDHKSLSNDGGYTHEYVEGNMIRSKYFGASAFFNVWNPKVAGRREFSLSQMWVVSAQKTPEMNSLEAGWMVYPRKFSDSQTRLFTYWTRDNYRTTRCYNYACNGFMQTNRKYRLGDAIQSDSVYGRKDRQKGVFIALSRDKIFGHWWLTFNDVEIGYFPRDIFTSLLYGAEQIAFGGEIVNTREGNQHTSTEMGNGHFSTEEFSKACYISNIQAIDQNYNIIHGDITHRIKVSKPECYDFTLGRPRTSFQSHFFFGGPGLSEKCP